MLHVEQLYKTMDEIFAIKEALETKTSLQISLYF